jgi:hypothetical protein
MLVLILYPVPAGVHCMELKVPMPHQIYLELKIPRDFTSVLQETCEFLIWARTGLFVTYFRLELAFTRSLVCRPVCCPHSIPTIKRVDYGK